MTDRLDRIEALLEHSEQRAAKRDEDIDTLLGAIATTEASVQKTDASVRRLTVKVEGNELIADTLRAEARADRLETRQLWNDAVDQMQSDRSEAQKDRAEFRAQADADRAENAKRFDAMQETIQRLLLAVVDLGRDNNRLRDRLDGLERAS